MAGLAEGASQRHQLDLERFPEAAGSLLQHLDGHAARRTLLGADHIGGNVRGHDDHGTGRKGADDQRGEQQKQSNKAHGCSGPG